MSKALDAIAEYLACVLLLWTYGSLITAMIQAEKIAPGYGADATVMRWVMMMNEQG